jgi:hypothetical protein
MMMNTTIEQRGDSVLAIIDDLNPTLRGWFGYFKHAWPTTFQALDGLIRRRLRAILRKQEKRPGMGRCYDDHRRWPNAYFANLGLFIMDTAWARASQSRCGNHWLESRVRENRTHGSEGGEDGVLLYPYQQEFDVYVGKDVHRRNSQS